MSYVLEIRNELGELIFGDGPIVYLRTQGDCLVGSDFAGHPGTNMDCLPHIYESFEHWAASYGHHVDGVQYGAHGGKPYHRMQWIADDIVASSILNGAGYPVPLQTQFDDLMFVELNAMGILQASAFCMDFAAFPKGKVMLIAPHPSQLGARLKYKVGSIEQPAHNGDTYAIQTFDASGLKTFDSRCPQLPIEDYFYLSQQQVTDILDGNLVFTHTLRVPISELYVSLPTFWAWKYIGSQFYTLHMKKISDTEVQISRASVTIGSAFTGQSVRDMMILFAK